MCPTRMARLEGAVRVVIAFQEAFNRHDVAGMMRLVSDDCLLETAGPAPEGAVIRGREAVAQYWEAFFRASPQAHVHLEDLFGLGLRCVARWRYDWVDAKGNEQHLRGIDIYQVRNGLLCEQLSYVKGK